MQVIIESYSGAIFTDILGIDYYNAYQNVGAIGVKLYEPGTEHLPAVLIGAHFDSSIGTPGDAHAASSCVNTLQHLSSLASGLQYKPTVPWYGALPVATGRPYHRRSNVQVAGMSLMVKSDVQVHQTAPAARAWRWRWPAPWWQTPLQGLLRLPSSC